MKKFAAALTILATAGACLAGNVAVADNVAGFYLGLGAGESTVRSDNNFSYNGYYGGCGYYYGYSGCGYDDSHHFAWKVMAGVRPISILGAEVEYIDFGHPGSDPSYTYYNNNFGPDSHPRAIAAFGVGHIPLPLPFLDIFGKLGAARLHTNVNGYDAYDTPVCQPNQVCSNAPAESSQSRWDTRFAYGAGVQTRFLGLSVRAEYERISSPYGDPDLFSVGATWTF